MDDYAQFEYLNLDARWPGFQLQNLEILPDGSLGLASVPRSLAPIGVPDDPSLVSPNSATGSGIAVVGDCDCTTFVSDPVLHRIWRIDGCTGEPSLTVLQGPGAEVGQVNQPLGLATAPSPAGWRLYIADSANHRIQVVDAQTQQVQAVWTHPTLVTPVDVAADRSDTVYVVDSASAQVQRYSADGTLDPTFWQALSERTDKPTAPRRVALVPVGSTWWIVILDVAHVVLADATGAAVGAGSWPINLPSPPLAITATADAIYIGCADGTLARFTLTGELRSSLQVSAHLAALAVGCDDQLLAGAGGVPLNVLQTTGGFLASGSLRAGPFSVRARPYEWQRLRVDADPMDAASHLQLFTWVGTDAAPPPAGFDPRVWVPSPADELDVLILGPELRQALVQGPPTDPASDQDPGPLRDVSIWIGATLSGDGSHSPVLRQMRLDWAPPAYLQHLPGVYREGARRPLLLGLVLSTLGSELDRVDDLLSSLTCLFDPAAAPADWLPWLAGWLDFQPAPGWSTQESRAHLMQAMDLYPWRGTAEGLRRYVEMFTGVHARIEEPASRVGLFRLDDSFALGFNTMLAPEHEQGAVLDTTAVPGQSSVLDPQDVGAPLFTDVVHRFSVHVYDAEIDTPATLAAVQRIVDAEKPAHAVSHVCVIGPSMRVGFQARIGVDSIVAGPLPDLMLGANGELGLDAIVANQPRRTTRLGQGTRVGGTL